MKLHVQVVTAALMLAYGAVAQAQSSSVQLYGQMTAGVGYRNHLTGDTSQSDLPKGSESGLVDAEQVLRGVPGIAFTHFDAEDVVRQSLAIAGEICIYTNMNHTVEVL